MEQCIWFIYTTGDESGLSKLCYLVLLLLNYIFIILVTSIFTLMIQAIWLVLNVFLWDGLVFVSSRSYNFYLFKNFDLR